MTVADKKETTNTIRVYQAYKRASGEFISDTSGWENDVNLRDQLGRTAMHYAASAGDETAITRLMDCDGVDIHIKDEKGNTPLIAAVKKEKAQVAEVLLIAGAKAKINELNQLDRTALSYAVKRGNIPMMDMLYKHGANMELFDNAGKTLAFYAAKSGNIEVLEWLAKRKTYTAFLGKQDEKGRTALFEVDNNHDETVNWLVRNDVLIERRDNSGDTPLLYAAKHGKVALLQALIKANASIDVEDAGEFSAVMLAAAHGRVLNLDALIGAGALINPQHRSSGETAAFLAAKNNQVDALQLLMFSNADITRCAKNGDTALLAAAKKDNEAVVNLLVEQYDAEKNTDVVDELARAPKVVFERILMSYKKNGHIKALQERFKERSVGGDKYAIMLGRIAEWQKASRETPVSDTAVSATAKPERKKLLADGLKVTSALKASLGGLLAKVSEKVKGSAPPASSEMVAPSVSQAPASATLPSAASALPSDDEMPALEDPSDPGFVASASRPGQISPPA